MTISRIQVNEYHCVKCGYSGLIDLMERKDQSQNDVQNVKSVIGMTKRKG
jgi:Zn ribbon nucleic-acid-binding protein